MFLRFSFPFFFKCMSTLDQIGQNLDQPEKWVPYLSVMQRLARLNPSAIGLAINQNGIKPNINY